MITDGVIGFYSVSAFKPIGKRLITLKLFLPAVFCHVAEPDAELRFFRGMRRNKVSKPCKKFFIKARTVFRQFFRAEMHVRDDEDSVFAC